MPATYHFISRWQVAAPASTAWQVITDSLNWPEWWADFERVEDISEGSASGIGNIRRYVLRTHGYRLSFCIEVSRVSEFSLIYGQASGDLEGTGKWIFTETNDHTLIECHWQVHSNIRWMNLLAFILRPVFEYNHKKVMERGATCLGGRLGCQVKVMQ